MKAIIDGDSLYCKSCDTIKKKQEFHKDTSSKRGHAYYCKECANSKSRNWTANNGHTERYRKAKWNSYYKFKYNLSLEDRNKLLQDQQYKCVICGTILNSSGTHTHTDHDHTTGKIRGLLCTNCNRGLGSFHDNIEHLKKAIMYLEKHLDSSGIQQEGSCL